jgi:hypothetical protein
MIIGIVLIVCLLTSSAFAMPVPSQNTESSVKTEVKGGGTLTDKELILIVIGAVCGTVILLALID